jgi:hypothetical protein
MFDKVVFWDEAALAVTGKIWEGDVLVLGNEGDSRTNVVLARRSMLGG